MTKRKANILLIIFLIISVIEILIIEKIILLSPENFNISLLLYPFVALLTAYILKKFIDFEVSRNKEKVKIVYKNIDKQKISKQDKETQEDIGNKIKKLTEDFIKGLSEIENDKKFAEEVLKRFSKKFEIVQGIFYLLSERKDAATGKIIQGYITLQDYAFYSIKEEEKKAVDEEEIRFIIGETLPGQVAKNKKVLLLDVFPDNFVIVASGLGKGTPKYIAFIPIVKNDKTIAVIEVASFVEYTKNTEQIFTSIADKLADYTEKFVKYYE
jgi:hypothetical protein